MKKGQTERLTTQHIKSGGAIGIFGKSAQAHDGSVSEAKYQGKDIENIQDGILVGKNKDQDLMVAGNAIERVYKNINEIRNYMLDELHFPYVIFLQGSNFATKIVQVFKPDGTFIEIRPDAGIMNRIDRVTAANYCMPINRNYCKNIFISNKKSSVMLQAASLYARCEAWTEKEMKVIMMKVAETSLDILNQLG